MDERELANHVLEIVDQTAYRVAARQVIGVHLAVGGRRGFDLDLLHTVFSDVVRGTVADGAEFFVKVLPVRHHCPNCRTNFEATKDDCPCPECGHPHTEIIGGEELRVLNLDIDDTAA